MEKSEIPSKINIFCINLRKNKSRWSESQAEFKKSGLNVNRFDAIEDKDFPYFGCSLSHRKIIETAKKNNWKMVLVFEDDIHFFAAKTIKKDIDAILLEVPDDFHIIYLWGAISRNTCIIKISNLIYRVTGLYNTHAILYHKRCYDELLKNIPPKRSWNKESTFVGKFQFIDHYLCYKFQVENPCYTYKKNLVWQRKNFSIIEKRWKKNDQRFLFFLYKYKYTRAFFIIIGYLLDIIWCSKKARGSKYFGKIINPSE